MGALAKTKTTLHTLQSLITELDTRQSPPLNLHTIIQQGSIGNPQISLAAEFKRASPSKGDIATDLDIATQITTYANAGASVVSVLTEPKWFKGSLIDLQSARLAVENQANTKSTLQTASAPTQQSRRVAVLRKDFIVDEYQIYEARAYGADTLLLIVAILSDSELTNLILKARELGMEPLVEVNSVSELTRALLCNALVIGVNNRNLHTFQVDLETTSRVANAITTQKLTNQKGGVPIVVALSGIKSREDVLNYEKIGVRGVLVGEALMRAADPNQMISFLIGTTINTTTLVKICGIQSVDDAVAAAKYGADLIGMIFVSNSKRCVNIETARNIVNEIRKFREEPNDNPIDWSEANALQRREGHNDSEWYTQWSAILNKNIKRKPPLVVGVFMNQTKEEILQIVQKQTLILYSFMATKALHCVIEIT